MKTSILIIDDEAVIREVLRRSLEKNDYQVFEASSAEEGIQLASSAKPKCIFLDITMPGMGGVNAIPILRRAMPTTPIIMLTAVVDKQISSMAMESGASDYLVKPIDLSALQRILKIHVAMVD